MNVQTNDKVYSFTSPGTAVNIKASPGYVGRLVINAIGSGATVTIYDATSGTTDPIWIWVTADGKVSIELNRRLVNGLRIVGSSATGVTGYVSYS